MPSSHPAIDPAFKRLDPQKKWKLSTGKVVDDTLYEFGKQCIVDHPACSLILDLDDKTYINEGIFTQAEIDEMKLKSPVQFITRIPEELATYINNFNCNNVKDLRSELLKPHQWENEYNINTHHDLDWVKHTIHSFVRLYESGNLKIVHKESWYNARMWSLIDITIFDDVGSLQAVQVSCQNHVCVIGFLIECVVLE